MTRSAASGYALVTGASGGIGLDIARLLAARGYSLILTARSGDKLLKLQQELQDAHAVDVQVLPLDLTGDQAPEQLFSFVQDGGWQVDMLVNNAGFGDHSAFLHSDWDRQRDMVQLNITALMQLCRLFGPAMEARGHGRILNVASVAAYTPGPYLATYYASKAFVLSFSHALRQELRGSGVTVTALCPGPTATGFSREAKVSRAPMFTHVKSATSQAVAEAGVRAVLAGREQVTTGAPFRLVNLLCRLVPRSLSARLTGWVNQSPRNAG